MVFAVNLWNQRVDFTLKFNVTLLKISFRHEAIAFTNLYKTFLIGIDENPLRLFKSESPNWDVITFNGNKLKVSEGLIVDLSLISEGVYLLKIQNGFFKLLHKRE